MLLLYNDTPWHLRHPVHTLCKNYRVRLYVLSARQPCGTLAVLLPRTMIAFLLLIGTVAVYGQDHNDGHSHNHSCIHNNQQQLEANQVITSVIADMEKDGDGIVEPTEVKTEFVTKYDKDMSGDVSEDEFVKQWHQRYQDDPDFAGYLFHHFDVNDDLKLTDSDIVALDKGLDTDGDGRVSVAEFQTYLTNLYTNCVPSHAH
ncbi:uncharacterized protein LOC124135228 [Haliotis rufescens]|uniref:uncharacterized protein LOC124135228 n=1 Tax=Haliotis rufescens TaxID=6454 RepID=UPI00201EDC18|nr:uncharacterized protein LOC124135228 [Haliotis rufescens]